MQYGEIFMLLRKIDFRMKNAADANLKKHNLTYSQMNVLFFVRKSGGTVSQKEIEDYLKVSHPTVVGLVQRLETAGYISCVRDETDKRNKLVSTTEKFEQLVKELEKRRSISNEAALEGFSEDDLDILTGYLNRLYENIKKERENNV